MPNTVINGQENINPFNRIMINVMGDQGTGHGSADMDLFTSGPSTEVAPNSPFCFTQASLNARGIEIDIRGIGEISVYTRDVGERSMYTLFKDRAPNVRTGPGILFLTNMEDVKSIIDSENTDTIRGLAKFQTNPMFARLVAVASNPALTYLRYVYPNFSESRKEAAHYAIAASGMIPPTTGEAELIKALEFRTGLHRFILQWGKEGWSALNKGWAGRAYDRKQNIMGRYCVGSGLWNLEYFDDTVSRAKERLQEETLRTTHSGDKRRRDRERMDQEAKKFCDPATT